MLAPDSTRLPSVSWPGFVDVGGFARSAVIPQTVRAGREFLDRRCWLDLDNNPPGPAGGRGTNWENPPGWKGGPGASPDRYRRCR